MDSWIDLNCLFSLFAFLVCFVVVFARLLFFTLFSLDTFTVDGKDVGLVTGVDLKRGDDYGVGATWIPAWVRSYFKICREKC